MPYMEQNNKEIVGNIFDIQRFSIHDGPGIRTMIFMKGCPLNCLWCANPEGIRFERSLQYIKRTCTNCGRCFEICPNGAIERTTDGFDWIKANCKECFECVDACKTNSRKYCGKLYTVNEVLNIVEKDEIYYRKSGGGMTISGGEPLAQPEFVISLLREAHNNYIDNAIETCGYYKWEFLNVAMNYLNTIYIDIKHMDSNFHKNLTGKPNEIILENIKKASQRLKLKNQQMIIRVPMIPGLNNSEENIEKTATFVRNLGNVEKMELLPYHRFGESKYDRTKWTGTYPLKGLDALNENDIQPLKEIVKSFGLKI